MRTHDTTLRVRRPSVAAHGTLTPQRHDQELLTCIGQNRVGDYYFGVLGKGACADYSVQVDLVLLDGECVPTPGEEMDAEGLVPLVMDQFGYANRYGICKPGAFVEYTFSLTEELAANNNLFVTVRTLTNIRIRGSLEGSADPVRRMPSPRRSGPQLAWGSCL